MPFALGPLTLLRAAVCLRPCPTSMPAGNVASGKVGQVFPATFASGNATISNVMGTGTATENKITLHFTVKSKGARVTVGMAFENVTSAKQIRLTQLNVTYLDLAKNSSALSGAASAVAKKLNDTTTGLDLAAASDKSYLCDAALTYALKSDKSQPLTLTSVALFDVQAQAFVRTGKMATGAWGQATCPVQNRGGASKRVRNRQGHVRTRPPVANCWWTADRSMSLDAFLIRCFFFVCGLSPLPTTPPTQHAHMAVEQTTRVRSAQGLPAATRRVYTLALVSYSLG